MTNKSYTLYLATKPLFGKYKSADKNIYQIIMEDIEYMNWFISIWDGPIDPRVTKMFNEFWERRNFQKHGFRNDVNYVTKKKS